MIFLIGYSFPNQSRQRFKKLVEKIIRGINKFLNYLNYYFFLITLGIPTNKMQHKNDENNKFVGRRQRESIRKPAKRTNSGAHSRNNESTTVYYPIMFIGLPG